MKKTPTSRSGKSVRTVSIIGTGSYVPEKILTNAELEASVETSDEWIVTRTGIRERRIARADEATSHLSAEAAKRAMEQAGVTPEEIDLIIVATVTPDTNFPATACWVQKHIGAVNAACFDLGAACSGFLYGIEVAQQFISNHTYETVLVIGADKLSTIVDWSDRNTCVLFGDGAGAAILRARENSHGVISTIMGSDGRFSDLLITPVGGSARPLTPENFDEKKHCLQMQGRETFKQAVVCMSNAARAALEQAGLTTDDLACIIPHQANARIIEALSDRLHIPLEKFHMNLDRYGNTSAAAVAIALDEANRSGRFQPGDYILLVVFGGGLTWASSVIEW
jgi:3-oxoacyl-[acyl-carrier-protein] synthase-3